MMRIVVIFLLAGVIVMEVSASGASGVPDIACQGNRPETLIDTSGRRISVITPFKRIISLYGAHTENLFALGIEAHIIGVSRHETFPPEALNRPVFSYHDDPEKFIAARPDLVIIRPMIDLAYPKLIKRLEQNGITVVSLQPGSIREMYDYWEALGKLTGKVAEALRMIQSFQDATLDFRKLAEKIKKKRTVYFEAVHSKMKTFTPGSMPIFVLETVGGINIASDAVSVRGSNIASYGKEKILSKGPDIDVYLAQTGVMNCPTLESIYKEPGFRVIRAVRNKAVFLVDEQAVSRPTFRLLRGMMEIGGSLYPGLFCEEGLGILKAAIKNRPEILGEVSAMGVCREPGVHH